MLPDDVLLDIFDFYVDKDFEEWITLAHVCRRWRSVVFQSPHRLNLRLVCTHKTRVRDTLDVVWPSLPLIIRHAENIKDGPSCVDNTIAALERNDRVCQIGLDCLRSSLEYVTNSAMQKPFPELTDLHLSMVDNSGPILRIPDSFLGGTAPRLRSLDLSNVLFPGLPKLLLIATRLVNINLDLYSIPRSGYITPEAIATSLSALTSLESLCLLFRYPQSRLALESRRPPPPPPPLTRSILPSLTKIRFKGTSKYLEEILARSDAPRLNEFHITFFNQIIFDTPQLFQFISRRPTLRALTEGRITFSSRAIVVRFTSRISDRRVLSVKIPCDASEWQLSSLEQVCTPSLPPLSALEDLYIFEDGAFARRWQGGIENTLWLDLLRSFVAVKNIYLSDRFVPRIAPALQECFGGEMTEVLPALEKIILLPPSGPLHKDIEKFVAARRLTGHPVAVSRWKQSTRSDYIVLLNNLLQAHRTGNLTPHFQCVVTKEGLGDKITHSATAKFRGVTYAVVRAKSKVGAKAAAAKVLFWDFLENGVPGT